MPQEFKIGDAVWAKMRGCSPWPGLVTQPKSSVKKPKKSGIQWIRFFGTKDYAWVDDTNIKSYLPLKDTLSNSNKTTSFKKAVVEIEEFVERRNEDPTYEPDEDSYLDSDFNRLKADSPKSAPKKRKNSGTKRLSTPQIKIQSKKKRLTLPEENGASPSYSTNHMSRNYDEILNRPSILDIPHSPTVDINNVSDDLKTRNIEASKLSFGFLGLGIMGSGIVKNLINSGHKVNIWSRSPRKAEDIKNQAEANHSGFVETYSTPCDVVENSQIIFCCVSDPAAVKDIVYGNCGVLHSRESLDGKGYVEMTSIDNETSTDICNLITSKGGRYLEAQLQGSKQEAHEGNLIVLGAGDKTLFDDCHTCFRAIGKTAFYLGDVGFAAKMNLVLQVVKSVALTGLAEAFALADRSGLAPNDVLEVFNLTSMCNPYLKRKAELIISTDFQKVEQPLQHMQKDTRLALQLADSLKQPLLMTATANEIYKHTRRFGCDSHDAASVYMRTRH